MWLFLIACTCATYLYVRIPLVRVVIQEASRTLVNTILDRASCQFYDRLMDEYAWLHWRTKALLLFRYGLLCLMKRDVAVGYTCIHQDTVVLIMISREGPCVRTVSTYDRSRRTNKPLGYMNGCWDITELILDLHSLSRTSPIEALQQTLQSQGHEPSLSDLHSVWNKVTS